MNILREKSGGSGVDRNGGAQPRSEDYGARGSSVKKRGARGAIPLALGTPVLPLQIFCIALCLILPAGGLWAMGRGDLPRGEVTVTGRVRLVGTAVFNDLVISDGEGRDWYVEGEDREKLAGKEQQQVTVRGSAETRDIILADGKKAGVRFVLRNITLPE